MFYNGIVEKGTDLSGKTRVRVDLGDLTTTFFFFDHDPTEEEVIAQTSVYISNLTNSAQYNKSTKLKEAEDRYILFCRSLGLPDRASSSDIDAYCATLKANGQGLLALEIAVRLLALINDVTQNGGTLGDITYHGLVKSE